MSGCVALTNKSTNCEDISQIGGTQPDGFAINLRDANGAKVEYTEDPTGKTITAITLPSGSKAVKFDGEKYAHSWGHSRAKVELTKYYSQTAIIREILGSGADLVWFNEMYKATALVLIFETPDQKFIVLGQNNGMTGTEGDSFNTGNTPDSDISTSLELTGEETLSPYKYFDTGNGYAANLAYLNGLLTPQ